MKRTIVILSTVVTLLAAGVLYGGHMNTDTQETLSLEEAYNASFSAQLPGVVIDTMNGFPM